MFLSLIPTANKSAAGSVFFTDNTTTDSRVTAGLIQLKASGANLYLLNLMNGAAATSYLQVFFAPVSKVTLGTTAPDLTIKIPTNAGSGFTQTIPFPVPVGGAGTGLSIAGTTTATGSTAAAIGVTAVYF